MIELYRRGRLTDAEWQAARMHHLGASEAAAALGMGMSGGRRRVELWGRKTGRLGSIEDNDAMMWGRALEPAILARAGRALGVQVDPCDATYQVPDCPYLTASPDGLATVDGELVTVEAKDGNEHDEADLAELHALGFPPKCSKIEGYWIQVQVQLLATGCARGYLAYKAGKRFHLVPVEANATAQRQILEGCRDFWESVINRVEPDGLSQYPDLLRELYPRAVSGSSVELDLSKRSVVRAWIAEYQSLEQEISLRTSARDEIKERVQALMREAERLELDDVVVEWKNERQGRFSSTLLQRARPDLYDAYRDPTPTRVFRVVARK